MPIQWIMLWERWVATDAKQRTDAFADPLEGVEWRGLLWAVPLIARLLHEHNVEPDKAVGVPVQPLWRPF